MTLRSGTDSEQIADAARDLSCDRAEEPAPAGSGPAHVKLSTETWLRSYLRRISSLLYVVCRGRVPATRWYLDYRRRYVERFLRDEQFMSAFSERQELPERFGMRLDERVIEYPWVISKLKRWNQPGCFLDAGSTLNHEMILSHPAVASHKWTLLTLAPEPQAFWQMGVSYAYEDLRRMPFRDDWFDAVFCISVIEHVGMDNVSYTGSNAYRERNHCDYLAAISEMKRVLKPGASLYLSVPFGRYEDHGWVQQFDSAMLASLIAHFDPQDVRKEFYRYTPQGWKPALEEECADLRYFYRRPGEPRSLAQDYAAAATGLACVELRK